MTFRKANIEDIKAIRNSFCCPKRPDNLDNFFDKFDGFVAIEDDKIVAFLYGIDLVDPLARKKRFYITEILVRDNYRYEGIENSLIECLLNYLVENDFNELLYFSSSQYTRNICKRIRGSSENETTQIKWFIQ